MFEIEFWIAVHCSCPSRQWMLRYGLLRDRVMHPMELMLAQGIPVYEFVAKPAGFVQGVPVSFDNVSHAQKRRMAGNSFNQACSTGMITFILASMKKKQGKKQWAEWCTGRDWTLRNIYCRSNINQIPIPITNDQVPHKIHMFGVCSLVYIYIYVCMVRSGQVRTCLDTLCVLEMYEIYFQLSDKILITKLNMSKQSQYRKMFLPTRYHVTRHNLCHAIGKMSLQTG